MYLKTKGGSYYHVNNETGAEFWNGNRATATIINSLIEARLLVEELETENPNRPVFIEMVEERN